MKQHLSSLQNRSVYSECYIPPNLLKIFEGEIKELIEQNRPKFTEQEPTNIPKPPEQPKFDDLFTVLIILCGIGLFFYFTIFLVGICLLLIGGYIHFLFVKRKYPQLLKVYNSEVLRFNEAKHFFKKKKKSIKRKLRFIINTQIHILSFLP